MKLSKEFSSLAAASAFLCLAAVCGQLAYRELSAAMISPGSGSSAAFFWSAPPIQVPITSGSRQHRRLLGSCLSILSSQEFSFQAPEVRSAIVENCAQQAHHAQESGVEMAEIPAVLAVERREAGDLAAVDQLLRQSYALAPTDLALILHRIRIGFSTFTTAELTRRDGLLETELPVLIGSGRGITTAASLYVQVPELRPIVDRLADGLAPVDRERFLGALRRQLRG